MIAWGIDLGGTKIECAVIKIEGNGFEVLHRQHIAHPDFRIGVKWFSDFIAKLS